MNYCTSCGHALGVGRFCTNCGKPVPGRHPGASVDPAVDAGVDAGVDPAAEAAAAPVGPPPAARYPLYADGAATPPPPPGLPLPPVQPAPPLLPGDPEHGSGDRPRRRGLLVALVAVLAVLVVVAAVVAVALAGSHDGPAAGHRSASALPAPSRTSATSATAPTSPTGPTGPSGASGPAQDLAPDVARIEVPGTAPASTDLAGHPVTFESRNMVDGDPETAWRVAGDASGSSITITFDKPVTLTSVGLINGYSKRYPGYNGYWLNRKILQVRWTFEDGTTITQDLRRRTTLQTTNVEAGPTRSIRLDIVSTIPSNKPNSRDYTAISEIGLEGTAS